jgi:hypothetical protein
MRHMSSLTWVPMAELRAKWYDFCGSVTSAMMRVEVALQRVNDAVMVRLHFPAMAPMVIKQATAASNVDALGGNIHSVPRHLLMHAQVN